MFRSSGSPGSSWRSIPSRMATMSAASERYGFTAESTERYSKRPGAETRSAVVRPQAVLARLLPVLRVRHEDVLVAAPERDVVVAAVRRDAHERLRHEAREGAELAADLLADLAERREVVGRLLRAVEAEVQLDLAGRVLVVALDHVEAELLAVLDHLVDDRLELGELVDVVAVRLRQAGHVGRPVLL